MGDLPAAGIISGVDVVKDRVRLREEFTKGVNFKFLRANSEYTLSVATQGTEEVQGGGWFVVSEREEDNAQAFTTSKGY